MNFKPFNTMEHIIVTPLSNGIVRLTPEAGYAMFNINTGLNTYSEAEVAEKEAGDFYAQLLPDSTDEPQSEEPAKEEVKPTDETPLEK